MEKMGRDSSAHWALAHARALSFSFSLSHQLYTQVAVGRAALLPPPRKLRKCHLKICHFGLQTQTLGEQQARKGMVSELPLVAREERAWHASLSATSSTRDNKTESTRKETKDRYCAQQGSHRGAVAFSGPIHLSSMSFTLP